MAKKNKIIIIIFGVFLAILFINNLANKIFYQRTKVCENLIAPNALFKPETFTLIGKPKIKKSVHPHNFIPFLSGDNRYLFDGSVRYANEKKKLTTDYEPILLIENQNVHYLLCQDFFNKELFKIYFTQTSSKNFSEINIFKRNPKEFFDLQFLDPAQNRLFKLWYIRESIRACGIHEGLALFANMIKNNPRIFFIPLFKYSNSREMSELYRGALIDCLQIFVDAKNRMKPPEITTLWDAVLMMLKQSQATDDPQEFEMVCYVLKSLDSNKAKSEILMFFQNIENDKIPNDARRL